MGTIEPEARQALALLIRVRDAARGLLAEAGCVPLSRPGAIRAARRLERLGDVAHWAAADLAEALAAFGEDDKVTR